MVKETTVVASANNVSVPVEKVISFEKSISEKDQTIGAQKETINNLKVQLENLKDTKEEIKDDQKLLVVKQNENNRHACGMCGYDNSRNNDRRLCYNCGHKLEVRTKPFDVIEYRNMDIIIADIRKEEAKNLGIDNNELQGQLNKAEFELNKMKVSYEKSNTNHAEELTSARRHVRESYQKDLEATEKKMQELVEEIQKLEENKTDEAVEAARKQEIIDLKESITELTEQIEESKKIPRLAKYWQRVADRSAQRKEDAIRKEKEHRIERISNSYPRVASKQSEKWWNKGRFAKAKDTFNPFNIFGSIPIKEEYDAFDEKECVPYDDGTSPW